VQTTHAVWLTEAIALSQLCPVSQRAFSVGAILVDPRGNVVATGYSRETDDASHAEEIAIAKAARAGVDLRGATLYSSLEPCSSRLSGKTSCADRIIAAGISRVVLAMREPPVFVNCQGIKLLEAHGIDVMVLEEFAPPVARINRHLLSDHPGQ
jgi:diaminohydroxyphosphoribosylaminopyrimidine deaminase/5-amino-6-(5-phosphoribosylamino)uracil reductase